MTPEEVGFWVAATLLAYVYVGYPVFMTAAAALRSPAVTAPVHATATWPMVTVIVTAYNEAARIGPRLDNLLALDYPRDRLEILVGSDGSSDGTATQARAWAARGVHVHAFAFRRGKPAMLNHLVPRARGSIVVLADARQRFGRGAITALVARFRDPAVGAVSGELVLTQSGTPTGVATGVGVYWRYETHIRRVESQVDSMVGATGAIYAIRRHLFLPIPDDTILDDVLIPMQVARAGYRVVSEGQAVAYDRVARHGREEFTRKARTLAGTFQLLSRHRWLLNPVRNRLWLQTLSHKALRLTCPLLLVVALVSSIALADSLPFLGLAVAQVVFYLLAVHSVVAGDKGRWSRLRSVPYTFCLLNAATVVAFWRFAVTGQAVMWERPSR